MLRFGEGSVDVAWPEGHPGDNRIADLLHGWFGPDAGEPGTDYRIRLERAGDTWYARPINPVRPTDEDRAYVRALVDAMAEADRPDSTYDEALFRHVRVLREMEDEAAMREYVETHELGLSADALETLIAGDTG